MPELPEVETTLRGLKPLLEGQKLTSVSTSGKRLRQPVPDLSPLAGRTITRLHRRAKYMLLETDGGTTLLLHLGMSGRMTRTPPHAKHTHLSLTTAAGSIHLYDPRRFGMVLLHPTAEMATHPLLAHLGPEPLDEAAFTAAYLVEQLKRRTTALKPALMDARVVVGVGNIYASESLFRAGLSPTMRANRLTKPKAQILIHHIRETLAHAIAAGGSSLRDYAHPSGELGNFQSDFNVYGRKGQPCRACGTPIQQLVQAQRSTFYCPACQK